MCLITEWKKPKVAKWDIIVYKTLSSSNLSIFYKFEYEVGILYTTEMKTTTKKAAIFNSSVDSIYFIDKYNSGLNTMLDELKIKSIGPGFHAYCNKKMVESTIRDTSRRIYKFMIPKGSLYYKDPVGHIVSNQIIRLT